MQAQPWNAVKAAVKGAVPQWALHLRERYRNGSNERVFTRIYREQAWGHSSDPEQVFFSGAGSHEGLVVEGYVAAVQAFLAQIGGRPDAVDLGCGDFAVGAQLRPFCRRYIACDVVKPVIEWDRIRYAGFDVQFQQCDFTRDTLPEGDVAFVRQVLQHLSNADIAKFVQHVGTRYQYLVVTEHVPHGDFEHNRDRPAGAHIRLQDRSGIVLTSAPFGLRPLAQRVICEVEQMGGVIRTVVYRMR
ncbi:MAG TPA: class I SAM-dependent methyltransferase [Burkholderiaceae bacterium]